MKKAVFFLTLSLVFSVLPFVYSAEIAPEGTRVRKLQRGFLNMALSPIELSHELAREKGKDDFVPSWFTGLGRGSFFMVGRALAGVYDLLTAPFPVPANYEPVVTPEFAWEHLPKEESKSKNLKTGSPRT